MLKLLNLDPEGYSLKALGLLEQYAEIVSFDGKHALEEIIADYDILLLRFATKIDKPLLEKAEKLKVIACNATGVDHIDTQYAEAKGIKIVSLKGEVEFLEDIHATAELSWGLLLSLVRKIPAACNDVVAGHWNRDQFLANELHGKCLGVLGYGRIGKKVARYANAFGMNVIAYDIAAKAFDSYVEKAESIEALLQTSDMLTIHIPFNESTNKLIDKKHLSCLPEGAFIVNTSRGAIIDEAALLSCLKSGSIAGAAVDVLCNENDKNFLEESALYQYASLHNNVIITPHIGGVTKESWEKTEVFIAQKVIKVLRGLAVTDRCI